MKQKKIKGNLHFLAETVHFIHFAPSYVVVFKNFTANLGMSVNINFFFISLRKIPFPNSRNTSKT